MQCHPERSEAEPKDPVEEPMGFATGFLDFARNDGAISAIHKYNLMKKTFLIVSAIVSCAFAAQAKLNVVATLPDFGALAREIGGDKIDIVVLAKPTEDSHFVDARPSFIVSLRSADVLIDGGAELELGWLPPLLQNARNPKIEVGKPGRVQASQGIRLMNVPANVTRAAGDVHALGNPHFAGDPIIAKAIAQHIAQSFAAVDPANAGTYDANYKKFETTINQKLQEWGAAMLPFKGQHVAAYHDSWPYFGHRFGLNIDIFLEPKPGIPPSPSHLTEVIAQMKAQHVKAVLVEPYHNRRIAEKVASATGAKVVDFAQFPGGIPGTDTYAKLIDALVSRLAAALK
jgi:zinc/manganese transport system substrate-binding protein